MSAEKSETEGYDYGPLRTYEITWTNGHVENLHGHQVSQSGGVALFGRSEGRPRFTIHGMFPDGWRMVLTATEEDVRIIRDVTAGKWVL